MVGVDDWAAVSWRGRVGLRPAVFVLGVLVAMVVAGRASAVTQGAIPDYLEIVVDEGTPASPADVAAANTEQLDVGMEVIYSATLEKYKRHLLERTPVIIALFSEWGGNMILYRPGHGRIEAPPVPPLYTWLKSVSHSTMAVYQLVGPYLLNPSDPSWRAPMAVYLAEVNTALATLDNLDVSSDVRERLRRMLQRDVSFMEGCLKTGKFSLESITAFATDVGPDIVQNVALAAKTQVDHWFGVLAQWKEMLGKDWEKAYAISNTLPVTKQNNILFTVLAQFMGQQAINDRLILVGTTEFTTTEDKIIDVLTRIVADRTVGQVFFRNLRIMDAELLGGAGRQAIEAAATARGMKPLIPPLAPFDTHEWPWPTRPDSGTGPSTMEQIPKQ